jgi:hypothetical protein
VKLVARINTGLAKTRAFVVRRCSYGGPSTERNMSKPSCPYPCQGGPRLLVLGPLEKRRYSRAGRVRATCSGWSVEHPFAAVVD